MVQFSDAELNLIAMVIQRSDPMALMTEAQSALQKIRAYAQERAQEQATQAAATEVSTEAD